MFYLVWKLRNLIPKANTKKKMQTNPRWATTTAGRKLCSNPSPSSRTCFTVKLGEPGISTRFSLSPT
ncbi:hypothetical protein LINGRAHAP2_LOCUS13359 [Linum grandiflorum]